MRGEAVQVVLPELTVRVQPRRSATHRHGMKADSADPAVTPPLDQVRSLEHSEMLADRGERHRKGMGKLAHGSLTHRKPGDYCAACGVRERAEDRVERRLRVNHSEPYVWFTI